MRHQCYMTRKITWGSSDKKGKYYYIAHDPAIMYTSLSKYQKQSDKHALNRNTM